MPGATRRASDCRNGGRLFLFEVADLAVVALAPFVDDVVTAGGVTLLVKADVADNGLPGAFLADGFGNHYRIVGAGLVGSLHHDLNGGVGVERVGDRKSTRLNSSHVKNS